MNFEAYAGTWTDEEIERYGRRVARLRKEGLSEMEADKLTERLLVRDREGGWDGIHLCFECKHLGKSRKCLKAGQTALPFTLMRCDGFEGRA
jgi:hypothetical protein